jgi:hypothetical protein
MRADVRIIAASNQSLRKLADQGSFRLDLYFRLDVLRLKLPPLRSRGADVAVLALHFVREFAREFARPTTSLTPAAIQKLVGYDWPGNIRELRYVIERSVLLSRGTVLHAQDIELEDDGEGAESLSFRAAKTQVVERFERQLIQRLLITHEGNVARAARAAGKNRRAFFELMRKYSIDAAEYRNAANAETRSNVYPLRRDAPPVKLRARPRACVFHAQGGQKPAHAWTTKSHSQVAEHVRFFARGARTTWTDSSRSACRARMNAAAGRLRARFRAGIALATSVRRIFLPCEPMKSSQHWCAHWRDICAPTPRRAIPAKVRATGG